MQESPSRFSGPREALRRILRIPREDARNAGVGFATLLTTIAAHALLETGRDTLFLTDLPAESLPWAYLAIAVLALAVAAWSRRLSARVERRRLLGGTLAAGAGVTLGFWHLCASPLPDTLFALYVWGGLLATSVTVQFWVLLSDLLARGHIKRTFSFLATGGLLGAVLGSMGAAGLLTAFPPRSLLLAAAALFGVASLLPRLFARTPPHPVPSHSTPTRDVRRLLRDDGYVRWLLALPLAAAAATTGVDFVFKSIVKASIAPERLGTFFSLFNTGVNALALAAQLFATRRLLNALGAGGSLAVLPSLSLAAAAGTALFGGLLPAALLKVSDGGLRHSLQRTGSELLFVPLARSSRALARALAGGPGQRGGQALGSLLTLFCVYLELAIQEIAAVVALFCGLWLVAAWRAGQQHRARLRRRGAAGVGRGGPAGPTLARAGR